MRAGRIAGPIPPALVTGELEILGLMPNSSNYTFLARAAGGGTPATPDVLGIYKPRRGEMPLWDFTDGTLCRREVAAYLVAEELGWPNVPPTVLREGPEGLGSVQLFVEFDPDNHYFTLEQTHPDEFRKVALFDHVVNNADRKAGHCLLGTDGLIWVIDHGVCFNEEPKLRTVIWGFLGEPIPAGLLEGLRKLALSLETGGDLHARLTDLLSPREIAALEERVRELILEGSFPEPGPGRPYPWPPI
jgi:uncharacterized repeat protein (TIGR03843 family)